MDNKKHDPNEIIVSLQEEPLSLSVDQLQNIFDSWEPYSYQPCDSFSEQAIQWESFMGEQITIDYTNYKGERSIRKIIPDRLYFGSNEYHKESQYLLDAYDLDKKAMRTFAMKDIHRWK